jgi:hypothetical protein
MKKRITSTLMLAACAAGFFAATERASAVATLAIDVGNNGSFDFIISDESIVPPVDSALGTIGSVTYMVPTGFGVISITSGFTKPNQGSAVSPNMALNNITGTGPAGVYAIYFSDTGFGPSHLSYFQDISFNPLNAPGASVTYEAYASLSNALFATTDLLASQAIVSDLGGYVSGTNPAPAYVTGAAPFSLTQKVIITIGGAGGTFGATANLKAVPDGGTSAALLGLSLLGLHGIRRKFAKA